MTGATYSTKVIIISGPTATFKSEIAIRLANLFNAPILNFDSLLFYRELSIGTAAPSPDKLQLVSHHLVQFATISNPINAASFASLAIPIINNHPIIFLVGGSGFYLKALIKGMYPDGNNLHKKKLLDIYNTEGIDPIYKKLQEVDPVKAKALHKNDHYRIIRALEYFLTNNKPISLQESTFSTNHLMTQSSHPWKILNIYLDMDKEDHLQNIYKRTDLMISNGLIEETRNLLKTFSPSLKPLQSIGYLQTIRYLDNYYSSMQEYIDSINISTRQLAKSQRTWFKKDTSKLIFNSKTELENNLRQIKSEIENFLF